MRPILAAVLVWSSAALAVEISTDVKSPPIRTDVTSTTITAWHVSNGNRTSCDDDYGEGMERFNVSSSWGDWVAGLRLDQSLYLNTPESTSLGARGNPCHKVELSSRYLNQFTPDFLQKIWLGWQGRHIEVTAGDSYVSFGRGLTLSLRKTDELGVDNSSRGARVKINTDRFSSTLVAGAININNVDESSGRYEPDPNDVVLGGTADVRMFDTLRVGASVAGYAFAGPVSTYPVPGVNQAYQEQWLVGGPKFDAPRLTDWLGVYLEGVGQRRTDVDGKVESGFGAYGTATAYSGPLTLLFEGKAYGDLAVVQPKFSSIDFNPVQYTSMPTAERVQQLISHPQRNIYGGRVRADYVLTPEVAVFGNVGVFRDYEGYQQPQTLEVMPGMIYDPYVGVDARLGLTRITAQSGYRWIRVPGATVISDGHLDLDVIRGFDGGASVEVHAIHLERREVTPFKDDASSNWREGTWVVSFRKRPWFAVGAVVDYSTEPGLPNVWYPAGTAEWDFTDSSILRIFAGSSRGGLRCVSGVCRIYPPFAGVKGSLILRL